MHALLAAGTPVVSIFGKSWDLHVHRALGITEEENLKLISDTVKYLKDHGQEVVYDAEHFFDGYTANPRFRAADARSRARRPAPTCCACAIPTAARSPARLAEIVAEVRKRFDGVLGIHPHNDSDVAVANALAAVEAGVDARAGLHERLRRALRQREPGLDHRQPGTEAGPHDDRRGEARAA